MNANTLESVGSKDSLFCHDRNKGKAAEPAAKIRLSLPQLLRLAGAILLIASGFTFMVQSWSGFENWFEFNHIVRYSCFLLFTVAISGAGFFAGLKLHDSRSARTLLAVACALVPVHFCQLGAFLYSRFGLLLDGYPGWVHWVAPGDFSAILTAIIGTVALAPVIYISFLVLARQQARVLSLVYLAVNALLLIPLRDSSAVAVIGFGMLLLLTTFDIKYLAKSPQMKTLEGAFCRIMLTTPMLLILGRTWYIYDMTLVMVGLSFAVPAVLMYLLPRMSTDSTSKGAARIQMCSIAPAAFSWQCISYEISSLLELSTPVHISLFFIPFGILLAVMGSYALSGKERYRRLGAMSATFPLITAMMILPNFNHQALMGLFCLVTTVACGSWAHQTKEKLVYGVSVFGFGAALAYELTYAYGVTGFSLWTYLGILGLVIVLGATYAERYINSGKNEEGEGVA